MANGFNAGDLRQVADLVERLEREAGDRMAVSAEAIPDPCELYRTTVRELLLIVRDIVCSDWVKRIIGSTPCTVVETVIRILDQLCPAQAPQA